MPILYFSKCSPRPRTQHLLRSLNLQTRVSSAMPILHFSKCSPRPWARHHLRIFKIHTIRPHLAFTVQSICRNMWNLCFRELPGDFDACLSLSIKAYVPCQWRPSEKFTFHFFCPIWTIIYPILPIYIYLSILLSLISFPPSFLLSFSKLKNKIFHTYPVQHDI